MPRKYSFEVVLCFFQFWQFFCGVLGNHAQPHIIFIIADDLGSNDVGFRGSNQIPTPNIDALAYNGIVLDRHYTQPTCTPSRAALLTGKYPIRYGLQAYPIKAGFADGIPLNETLLSEHLQKLGYVTRMIGKWHLGFATSSMTPTKRGFHSHFGYLNGYVSYKNATLIYPNFTGFDCYRNLQRSKHEVMGKYLTDVYTEEAVSVIKSHSGSAAPLFLVVSHLAPHTGGPNLLEVKDETENSKKYAYISNPTRRLFAGVMESLDSSVGEIIKALDSQNMLQNSVIAFISDNGGQTVDRSPLKLCENSASNWPLRGLKFSPFDGSIRNVAVVWSPKFKQPGRVSSSYMHITDWLPTLYSAAGGNSDHLQGLDGIDQWNYLIEDQKTGPRNHALLHLSEKSGEWAILRDEWKLLKVNSSIPENYAHHYYGETGRDGEYRLDLVFESPVSKILQRYHSNSEAREDYLELRKNLDLSLSPGCMERIQTAGNSTDVAYSGMVPPDRDRCNQTPCLFNIRQDPCEFHNVADQHPAIVGELQELLAGYNSQLVKQQDHKFDPASLPKNWGGYWSPWMDNGNSGSG